MRRSFWAHAYGSSSDTNDDPKVGGPSPADELPAGMSSDSKLLTLVRVSMPAAAAAAAMAEGGTLLIEGD